jgi:hypothetical protein
MRGGGVSQTYKENNIIQKSPKTTISEYSSLLSLSSAIFLLFLRSTICSLTYRLDNVPRTVRIIGGLNRLENSTVTADSVITAIRDSTGQTAIRATETKKSIESGLFNTSWTIHFLAATHKPIPRTRHYASAHPISLKPKTTQCTRCYLWHNSRSCTRPQRCRLCGSNNHLDQKQLN